MSFQPYPLQFNPILKERIWGGTKLKTMFNKPITSDITGESWELSEVEGDVSVVSNGVYKGMSLTALLHEFPDELLGGSVHARFGKQFPLLFKFLDAREDLSIQVHPNDKLARERHNSFGKTEMWYVMQADPGARIIVGFEQQSSPEQYLSSLRSNTILDLLHQVNAEKGDVFFLETGTVHAIGAGLVIAEIQQTSDITYRIYDFDRKDANGNTRELHVEQALDAINYELTDTKKDYDKQRNKSNSVVDCPYFTTNYIPLDGASAVQKKGGSFTVYMCVGGSFTLLLGDHSFEYKTGDTVLLPAAVESFTLAGKAELLEIYIS